jgi:hypothetical protein
MGGHDERENTLNQLLVEMDGEMKVWKCGSSKSKEYNKEYWKDEEGGVVESMFLLISPCIVMTKVEMLLCLCRFFYYNWCCGSGWNQPPRHSG